MPRSKERILYPDLRVPITRLRPRPPALKKVQNIVICIPSAKLLIAQDDVFITASFEFETMPGTYSTRDFRTIALAYAVYGIGDDEKGVRPQQIRGWSENSSYLIYPATPGTVIQNAVLLYAHQMVLKVRLLSDTLFKLH